MNTDKKTEALKLALEALESVKHKIDSYQVNVCDDVDEAITAVREALAEQPAQQEQGDSNCQDADGCPTEMAVLQRFWRGEPIPTEHYPVWFKPAQQQEPVAWVLVDGELSYPDEIDWETLKEQGHEVELLYTSPQPSKPWVGLTQQEQASVLASVPTVPFEGDWHLALFTAIEAKLREKNA